MGEGFSPYICPLGNYLFSILYSVQPEILVGIKFGGWEIAICKNIGGFKFGGSVRNHHTYICKYEILVDFNLVIARRTTKPPNLIPRQIFRLYGTCRKVAWEWPGDEASIYTSYHRYQVHVARPSLKFLNAVRQ